MKRRHFLAALEGFCVAYGIDSVLANSARASVGQPKRLVSFVTKYTGGSTLADGVGEWHTGSSLAPLAPFEADLSVPLGLSCDFHAPMNSHAAPQVCALSGSMTGFVLRETHYPKGNLANISTGGGKSIDMLIGEKLQREHMTSLPMLSIGNNMRVSADPTQGTSSWGAGGTIVPAHASVKSLAEELESHRGCDSLSDVAGQRRLRALEHIRRNTDVFGSRYLIDRVKFEKMVETNRQATESVQSQSARDTEANVESCNGFWAKYKAATQHDVGSESNANVFDQKMPLLLDLAFEALRSNITRVVTINLHEVAFHATSHFEGTPAMWAEYLRLGKRHQAIAAGFMQRLKDAGMYEDTLFYGNAGTCATNNVHNYENLAIYTVNGGRTGVVGSPADPKPIGSYLLDILRKFGIDYSEFGGTDHKLGVGTAAGFV